MKQPFKLIMPWLMTCVLIDTASKVALGAPVSVELNGVSSFFGVHLACLVVQSPDSPAPQGFMLGEGESKFGIRLISVDTKSNVVKIENGGKIQSLQICATPDLPASLVPGTVEYQELLARAGNNGGNDYVVNSGSDGSVNGGNPALVGSGGNRILRQDSRALLNGADPASALKDQAGSDWYQNSAVIEKERMQTAPDVLAGKSQPWPLTPLTPAGTPTILINNDVVYANHIPGFSQD